MGQRTKIPLTLATGVVHDRSVSSQRLLNMYAEKMPDNAKEPAELITREGLYPIASVGELSGDATDGIRMMQELDGKLYVASGTELYSLDASLNATPVGNIGTTQSIQSATDGDSLAMALDDGDFYTLYNGAFGVTPFPDGSLVGDLAFLAGRYVASLQGTGQFRVSALLNPTDWPGALLFTAEYMPDNITGLIEFRGDLWIFGQHTTEIWGATAATDAPFQRLQSGINNVGCIGRDTIAKDKARLYWVSTDREVMSANSYSPERISTHAVEKILMEAGDALADAYSFCYTLRGHDFYVLTIPGVKTLVYDSTTKLWHERDTFGRPEWLAAAAILFGDRLIAAEGFHGNRLFSVEADWAYDGNATTGVELVREVCFPTVSADDASITYDKVFADIFAADGVIKVETDPLVMLQWSDDGGRRWGNWHIRSIGRRGAYIRRVIWRSLGQSRQRIFKLRMSTPIKLSISALVADVELNGDG
ncbi:hypothetical protein FACS1894186_4890 [Alphaproteobacteria bacterium]|nr:hypothetical protein FACS1894186_4890 [Alphaproteobacteria bacterium]